MPSPKNILWLWERATLFYISFLCICLELFATRILNLKTFNHVVYVIIPFAILGYGIGANIYFLQARKTKLPDSRIPLSLCLAALGILCVVTTALLIRMPLSVQHSSSISTTDLPYLWPIWYSCCHLLSSDTWFYFYSLHIRKNPENYTAGIYWVPDAGPSDFSSLSIIFRSCIPSFSCR